MVDVGNVGSTVPAFPKVPGSTPGLHTAWFLGNTNRVQLIFFRLMLTKIGHCSCITVLPCCILAPYFFNFWFPNLYINWRLYSCMHVDWIIFRCTDTIAHLLVIGGQKMHQKSISSIQYLQIVCYCDTLLPKTWKAAVTLQSYWLAVNVLCMIVVGANSYTTEHKRSSGDLYEGQSTLQGQRERHCLEVCPFRSCLQCTMHMHAKYNNL